MTAMMVVLTTVNSSSSAGGDILVVAGCRGDGCMCRNRDSDFDDVCGVRGGIGSGSDHDSDKDDHGGGDGGAGGPDSDGGCFDGDNMVMTVVVTMEVALRVHVILAAMGMLVGIMIAVEVGFFWW